MSRKSIAMVVIAVLAIAAVAAYAADATVVSFGLAVALIALAAAAGISALADGRRRAKEAKAVEARLTARFSALEKSLTGAMDELRRSLATQADQHHAETVETIETTGATGRQHTGRIGSQIKTSVAQHAQGTAVTQQFASRHSPGAMLPFPGSWALDGAHLADLVDVVRRERPALVLELGSGTSTVWLAYEAKVYGGTVVSVDHLDHYAGQTREALARHGLESVAQVKVSPLADAGIAGHETEWYGTDVFAHMAPRSVELLLVDGPPATTGPAVRRPALPLLRGLLAPGAILLLDDTVRPEEDEIFDAWLELLGDDVAEELVLAPGMRGVRLRRD